MSIVRVAVPVLQGRRKFHFDKGRPWSVLERIILVSLARSDATASSLADRANVPRRLVVESLIRLMRAGWIQMIEAAGGVTFSPTQAGLAAAVADELPSVTRRMKRTMTFVVDQVVGGVFRSREFPFLHTHMVEERATREAVVWLERPTHPIVDEVRQLSDALFQDDEKLVGSDPSGDRLNERWSLVTVRDGEPDGLTQRASPQLVGAIKAAAKQWTGVQPRTAFRVVPSQNDTRRNPPIRTHDLNIIAGDILVGGPEHGEAIATILKKARHRIIIHSTFIAEPRFDALLGPMKDAHHRGAAIDIMWGQNDQVAELRSTRQVVEKLRQRLGAEKLDRLTIHPFSTHSHSKFIVADTGTMDQFVCVVGSCNWLYSSFENIEMSVRLRAPAIIGDAVDELAELSRGKGGYWTDFTSNLAGLAAHLRSLRDNGGGRAKVSLVLGSRHSDLVRAARDEAKRRIVIASHRLSNVAHTAVLAPAIASAQDRGIATDIFYGVKGNPMTGAELSNIVIDGRQHAIKISPVHDPRLHAKFLAWDDDAIVITSQNWLSADPPDDAPRAEIGVCIRAPGIARSVLDRFNALRR